MMRILLGSEQRALPWTFPSHCCPFLSLHSPLHVLLWEQPDPCVMVKSCYLSPLYCYYTLLLGLIVTYCSLAFCQLAPLCRFRSRPERLSHGRITSGGVAPYNIVFLAKPGDFIVRRDSAQKTLKWCHEDFPSGCSLADKQCCRPPNMSTSCPPMQKIIDCQKCFIFFLCTRVQACMAICNYVEAAKSK